MQCPSCSTENPPANRFCDQCGAPLEARCPQCATALRPGARFCGACGHRLTPSTPSSEESPPREVVPRPRTIASYTPKHLADKVLKARSAIEGERRQVTVLFADIAGFTSVAEGRDPEEVHQILDRAFEAITAEVHRFEGTVNQYTGDGVMALFGAPIAHEDHARRAVHAALGIQRALADYQRELSPRGITFRARQGLNTGLVVVGSIGGDLRMDYTAVGDTTNVAARLQQASEPGRVTISEATQRLVHGYVETRALGHLQVKGKAEPVQVWEAVEARSRFGLPANGPVVGIFGALAGYHGGTFDLVIQRIIEVLQSLPSIPLWMALAAIMPVTWSPLLIYFGLTIIFGLLDWTGLARAVRSKLLALREEDYVLAAQLMGANSRRIIGRHLVPGFVSHLIMDTFTKEGVPWLFPIPIRFGIPPFSFLRLKTGGMLEKTFVFPGLILLNF